MKRPLLAAVALACVFTSAPGSAPAADKVWVTVYDATELTLDRYTVLKRIWTQTAHAAFWVPTYEDRADAITELTSRAAEEGADGVINLHCLNDTGGWGGGYFCYGLAIKLK
ncbi:MAG TPA: hypothetical protein VLC73_16940 [Burkholderiales bacterium]|nr:hypothetical protein [Burkholderiales bacterium]